MGDRQLYDSAVSQAGTLTVWNQTFPVEVLPPDIFLPGFGQFPQN